MVATENDALNGVSMLFGHLLTGKQTMKPYQECTFTIRTIIGSRISPEIVIYTEIGTSSQTVFTSVAAELCP